MKRLLGRGESIDAFTKDTEAGATLRKISDPFDLPSDNDTSAKAVVVGSKAKLDSDIAVDDDNEVCVCVCVCVYEC